LLAILFASACDSAPAAAAADPKAEAAAKEEADAKARIEKRKADREAKEAAAIKEAADIKIELEKITVIPEGTKIPKKPAEACEMVVEAQRGFMKKFHGQVEEAALTTQLGLLRKQCTDMNDVKVAMCQKFALEATTELLQKSINEYLPVCMGKYGKK
jgi:hypothetical protein